jgi:hypothetical protein
VGEAEGEQTEPVNHNWRFGRATDRRLHRYSRAVHCNLMEWRRISEDARSQVSFYAYRRWHRYMRRDHSAVSDAIFRARITTAALRWTPLFGQ